MEKELGSDVIKATQTSLGKYVKRPPLSEKLLRKPPFRFLHDIVTTVLKTHGFFEGLFDENELISENVKDRDTKILFLNKVISVLVLTTGKNLSVKPSKIVAGQEPEKTNELLQCIAYALDKNLKSDEAVKIFKDNSKGAADPKPKEKEIKNIKKSIESKKNTSKSNEKLLNNKKESAPVNKSEKNKPSESKSKRKDIDLKKNDSQVKKVRNMKSIEKKSSTDSITQQSHTESLPVQDHQELIIAVSSGEIKQDVNIAHELKDTNASETQDTTTETMPSVEQHNPGSDQEVQGKLNSSYTIADNELNSSLSSQDLMEVENVKLDESKSTDKMALNQIRVSSAIKVDNLKGKEEATSSKTNIPVLVPNHESFDLESNSRGSEKSFVHDVVINSSSKQNSEVVRPSSVRPSSSRPGAPRLREKIDNIIPENENLILAKINIIAENVQNEEEEDNSIIIVEQHALEFENNVQDQKDVLDSNEHGHLVQQILNSQKELSQIAGKTEIEWQFGAQKAKEASSQEIEQLRFNIQALSRVANPLGKLLDHIQEDVEVMRQELQQWNNLYEEVSRDMLKEKAASQETLVPLQTRVKQINVDIEEKRDKINDIKILIHKNTTRIEKLLANGTVQ